MVLWYFDGYWTYSLCICVVSSAAIVSELVETTKNTNQIRHMARYSTPIRLTDTTTVDSAELVPGDVIEVPQAASMPCDCIVLTGTVIVNEAMLTGESIPVIKSSLPNT